MESPFCPFCQAEMARLLVFDHDEQGAAYVLCGWQCACVYEDEHEMMLYEECGGEA